MYGNPGYQNFATIWEYRSIIAPMSHSILDPKLTATMLSEAKPQIGPPEVKHFQFVVILVEDTNPEQVPAMINAVMSTLVHYHANISNVAPPLIMALLGVPFLESNSPEKRRELVDALLRENSERVRIAHGACDGAVGIFGGDGRRTYSAVIPGFAEILQKLLPAKFGAAIEAT